MKNIHVIGTTKDLLEMVNHPGTKMKYENVTSPLICLIEKYCQVLFGLPRLFRSTVIQRSFLFLVPIEL